MQSVSFPHPKVRAPPIAVAQRKGKTELGRSRKLELYLGNLNWARAPPDSRGSATARADFAANEMPVVKSGAIDLSQFASRTQLADSDWESSKPGGLESLSSSSVESSNVENARASMHMTLIKTRHLKGISESSKSFKRDLARTKPVKVDSARFSSGSRLRSLTSKKSGLKSGLKELELGKSRHEDLMNFDSVKPNDGSVTERTLSTRPEGFPFRRFGIKSQQTAWNLRRALQSEDTHKLVSQLAVAILQNPSLRDLDISLNYLDATAGAVLGAALKRHGNIKTVSELPLGDLQENAIDTISAAGKFLGPGETVIIAVFLLNNASLTSLDLSSTSIGREAIDALAYGLRGLTQMTHLNLSRTGIRGDEMNTIAQGLKSYRKLHGLLLGTNFIDSTGAQIMGRVLQDNRNLRTLVLRNNKIGAVGMRAIGRCFASLQNLHELDVANNNIGSEGMRHVGSEWGHLRSLLALNMSFNDIQPDSMLHFIGELKNLRNLLTVHFNAEFHVDIARSHSTLDLRTSGMRSLEAFVCAAIIRENITLCSLDLRGNSLADGSGPAAYEEVADVILILPRLNELNGEEFSPPDHDVESVAEILRRGDLQWISQAIGSMSTLRSLEPDPNDGASAFPQLASGRVDPSDALAGIATAAVAHSRGDLPSLVSPEPCFDAQLHASGNNGETTPDDADREASMDLSMTASLDSTEDLRRSVFGAAGAFASRPDHGLPLDDADASSSSSDASPSVRSPRTPFFRPGRSTRLRKPAGASPHALDFVRRTARAAKRSTQNGSTGPRSSRRAALAPGKEGLISRSDLAQLSDMLAAVQDKPEQPERRSPERQRQRGGASVTPGGGQRGSRPARTVSGVSFDTAVAMAEGGRSPPPVLRLSSGAEPAMAPKVIRRGERRAMQAKEAAEARSPMAGGDEAGLDMTAWHLAGQRLGSSGVKALAARVSQEQGKVALVDLSLNNVTGLDEHGAGKVDLSGFRALCSAWAKYSRLVSLNLAWNSLGPESISVLRPALRAHRSLTKLDLYKNSLQAEGMATLCEVLRSLTALQDLDIRYNRIGPQGGIELANTLLELPFLRRLDAAHNSLGAEGLADVAEVLTSLRNLSILDLRDNEGGKLGNESLLRLVLTRGHQLESVDCLSLERLLQDQRDVGQLQQMLPKVLENYEALFFSMLLQRADRLASERLHLIYYHSRDALASIDLSGCQLEDFPPSLLLLTALEELDVSDNSISQVPAQELCSLKRLHTFSCDGNPHLYTPPPEVARQGGKRALLYLREVVRSGEHDDEMALILIGPSEGGKSSCIRALRDAALSQNWAPPGARRGGRVNMRRASVHGRRPSATSVRRTSMASMAGGAAAAQFVSQRRGTVSGVRGVMGISRTSSIDSNPELKDEPEHKAVDEIGETVVVDMSQWRVSPDMTFSVYDLPGQELYSASNLLFLKHRALYLFVWRVRSFVNDKAYTKGMRALSENIRGWLETLQSKVRGAAILMVATHIDVASAHDISQQCDMVKRVVNRTMTSMDERKYGCSLHAFKQGTSIPVSCATGDGLRELFDDIHKFTNAMDAFHATFPRKYLHLRNELHIVRERKPWMPWKEYEQLAERCGINAEEIQTATPLLHQLGHLWYFGNIANAVGATKRQLKDDLLLGTVIVSVNWMVDCIRGLLRQDRTMLLGWFAGDHGREHHSDGMLKKGLELMSTGRIDPILLPYLWPRQEVSWAFWDKAMDTTEKKVWSRDVVGDEQDCQRVVQLLKGLGLVAERAQSQLVVPTLVNGSYRRTIDARALSIDEGSLVGQRKYAGLPQCFFQLVALRVLDTEDDVDFNGFAAAVYRSGMKGQLLLASVSNSNERTLTIAASHRILWEELHRKILRVEEHFPGLCVLSSTEPAQEEGGAAHVTIVHSLYAMTQAEAVGEIVQRMDKSLIVRHYELLQFRKLLAALSSKARDGFHKAAIDDMRKLREFSFTSDNALVHERLAKAGIPEKDRLRIDELLNGPNKPCRLVILCLDPLAQSVDDTDLQRITTFHNLRVPILLLLLPGALLRSNLLPTRTPTPVGGVIDLRDPLFWTQDGHSWILSSAPKVLSMVHQPIRTILEGWRGLPPRGTDFSLELQSIVCRECTREEQLIPHSWNRAACERSLAAILKAQVANLDLRDEPTEQCGSEHQFSLLSILTQPSPHVALPCPNCLDLGISPPFCFSRRKCIAVIEPERGEVVPKPRGRGALELDCPLCHGIPPNDKDRKMTGRKDTAATGRDSAAAGKDAAKPAEHKPLDLGRVLQPEVFVSFFRPQTSCHVCADIVTDRQAQAERNSLTARSAMTGTRQLSRASSTNKKTCEASRNLSSDGISTEGKCADCIEGIHKRETVLQLMQRVEQATGVCCVKRSAQAFAQPLSRKASSKLLRQAVVFIALLDKDYVRSPQCCVEFSHAVSSSIYILPIILPGYKARTDSPEWWPQDAKVKDDDGAWVAVPWSMLENFPPVYLPSLHDKKRIKAAEQHIMRVVMARLYRGDYADHSTLKLYDEWKKAKAALLSGLGNLATMSLDELDEMVMRLFKELDKDRSGYIDLREMQYGLASMGAHLTDDEAMSMMKEADVDASMQLDPHEFRKVVFALMASSTVRMMQERSRHHP